MKQRRILPGILIILMVISLIAFVGCSSDSSGTPADDTNGGGDTDTTQTVSAVSITASPDAINPGETTTITATVYDASGNIIANVEVLFTLDKPTLAFLTSTMTTDENGEAPVTLTARDTSGEVAVTATASDVTSDTPAAVTILGGAVPNDIILSVNPTAILVQGTATVTAQVLDVNQDPVEDGTPVLFGVTNSSLGAFTSATATTNSGLATTTFEAADISTTAILTAGSGSVTEEVDLTILQAPPAAIEFSSADPQRIALQGSGGLETSTIQFIVKDSNGNPQENVTVSFVMAGPNGGEYIDPSSDGTPDEIDVSTDANGVAQVILHSGTVAGPVTVKATISIPGDDPITAQSSVVSIGGGVPSAKRFGAAATILNLPGLQEEGVETEITAFLADRFGNYNMLPGTTVSFVSEIGLAIDTSDVTVGENGTATSIARTQTPIAVNIPPVEDVAPETWETQLQTYIQQTYGVTLSGHPRDGLCSVMVYVKGEEHFQDANANGIYDPGETIIDTDDDPYIDYNDDGVRDNGTADPFEEYIDSGTGNGVWDGPNGVWDGDKNIFANFKILITGREAIVAADTTTFDVPNGGSQLIKVIVCDRNGNPLTPGSTVTISTDKGKVVGAINSEFLNSSAIGPTRDGHLGLIEFWFWIQDSSPDQVKPETATITVSVKWEGSLSSITTDYIVASGSVE
ncbi:MAG: Ig-like domain-containing protein [Deltaproteobacteria bacterium]|nr:Ig-like domain-containing protein [Deltaproteobacteria bacterium]